MTNAAVVTTHSQPKSFSSQVSALLVAAPIPLGANAPQTTNASTAAAATPKTALSSGSDRCGPRGGVGSGCASVALLTVSVTATPPGCRLSEAWLAMSAPGRAGQTL